MSQQTANALTRRTLLRTCGIGIIALGTPLIYAKANPKATPHKKNVLLLYVDDLRPELKCYGKSTIISPNINKLAARSVLLNKAYCQIPVCMPSRTSTMSGKYPRRPAGHLRQLLHKDLPSLPGHFKANGYDTISIGKIYHHNDDDAASWTKRYTDTFWEKEYACDGWSSGYQLEKNRKAVKSKNKYSRPLTECVDAPDNAYPDGRTANNAIAQLKAHAKSKTPLFLAAGFYRPHLPWAVPKKYWDLYKRNEIQLAKKQSFPKGAIGRSTWCDLRHYNDTEVNGADLRKNHTPESFPVLSEAKQRELIHAYQASVSFVDAQIGRILDALDTLGMTENTTVILCGDHGWHLGEYKLWAKVTCYEESLRVPLIVAAPGVAKPAKTDGLTELVDIYPTLCELSGLTIPPHVEGTSMVPLLKDPTRKWKTAAFSIWVGSQSMRTERYRLTVFKKAMPKGSLLQLPTTGRHELYDYKTDPAGNTNIATNPKNKALLNRLLVRLKAGPKGARPKKE